MQVITIRVRGNRQGVKRLLSTLPAVLSGDVADTTGLARSLAMRLGMVALSLVKQAFVEKASGGMDESGMRWVPLKPGTIAGRRKGTNVGSVQILRDTGILLNSFSPGDPHNVLDARSGLASVGTSCPYARYQHEGTATIPARPLWPKPKDWSKRWLEALAKEMVNGVAALAVKVLKG